MKLFKKVENEISIDNDIQIEESTNDRTQEVEKKSKLKKFKILFFILNIFSVALYTLYTIYTAYNSTNSPILMKIIFITLVVYVIVFVALLIYNRANKKRMKSQMKDFKGTVNILKQLVKIINLALAMMTAFSAFLSGSLTNVFTLIFGGFAIMIAVLSILMEIAKIIIRKKLSKLKAKFEAKKLQNNEQN